MFDDFSFRDFKEFMETRKSRNRPIARTIPVKPEWKTKHTEMIEMVQKLEFESKRLESLRNKFWADIELELGEFGDMSYNLKTHEIEIYTKDNEKGLVKSPYQ